MSLAITNRTVIKSLVFYTFTLLLCCTQQGRAAQYNMFFNNVEQGPNSTTNPSLTINGVPQSNSKPQVTTNSPENFSSNTNNESPVPVDGEALLKGQSQVQATPQATTNPTYKKWRFGLLGQVMNRWDNQWGMQAEFSFNPLKHLGFNIFGGANLTGFTKNAYFGGELQIIPVSVALFDQADFLQIIATAGASTIKPQLYAYDNDWRSERWGTIHCGAKARVRISDTYSLQAGIQTNLTDRSSGNYVQAQAGLSVAI